MPRTGNQKQKLLIMADIFREETDEEHPLSVNDLISRLGSMGISAERKSIYSDIEELCVYGLAIEKTGNAKNTAYYLAERDFELPELKLLADAVACSRFITEKKSNQLIAKLGTLANKYEAGELKRDVIVYDRIKNINEQIYYNIDAIQRAVSEKKKIRFLYFDYDSHRAKKYHNGGAYIEMSPYALCWREENYYLVGYYPKYESVTNFRVDKIEGVEITDENREKPPKDFSLGDYTKKRFGMFSGEDTRVTLRVEEALSGVIFDRFGKNVTLLSEDNGHFLINQTVTLSPIFYAWIFQFGGRMEIVAPEAVREDFRAYLKSVMDKYED